MSHSRRVFNSLSDIPNVLTSLIQQSTTRETSFSDAESQDVDDNDTIINRYLSLAPLPVIMIYRENQTKKQTLYNKRCKDKRDLIHKQSANFKQITQIKNQLHQHQAKIQETEDKIFKFDGVYIEKRQNDIKFMVVIGNTQQGKSTLCNRLSGDKSKKGDKGPFIAKRSTRSVTRHIQHYECTMNDADAVIVDVPSWNENENKHEQYIENLTSYLYGCGGVDAFILTINGTSACIDMNLQNMLRYYEKWFGKEFWNHLIIVFTRIEGHFVEEYDEMKQDFIKEIEKNFNENNFRVLSIGRDDDFELFNKNMIKCVMKCDDLVNGYIKQIYNGYVSMDIIIIINDYNDRGYCAKLECMKMKSSLTELKRGSQRLLMKKRTLSCDLTKIQCRLRKINEKLENPEIFPILFSSDESDPDQ